MGGLVLGVLTDLLTGNKAPKKRQEEPPHYHDENGKAIPLEPSDSAAPQKSPAKRTPRTVMWNVRNQ